MHLLRVLPPQIFFSPRSERMFMRQLHYNPLFRWFVSLEIDEVAWNHAVFSKNRERLLNGPPRGSSSRASRSKRIRTYPRITSLHSQPPFLTTRLTYRALLLGSLLCVLS